MRPLRIRRSSGDHLHKSSLDRRLNSKTSIPAARALATCSGADGRVEQMMLSNRLGSRFVAIWVAMISAPEVIMQSMIVRTQSRRRDPVIRRALRCWVAADRRLLDTGGQIATIRNHGKVAVDVCRIDLPSLSHRMSGGGGEQAKYQPELFLVLTRKKDVCREHTDRTRDQAASVELDGVL